jgi:prolyl-tRNA synthetase
MAKAPQNAISPTREENFPEWYQQVVRAADLAENSEVRGCMVIKPWGYGVWEQIQQQLDVIFKETGHKNAYFPLLIPVSYLEKEATHVEGFATECAVVTHHRLELQDGKMVPAGKLTEPFVIRPTSETIIGAAFARWVQSYRDLPLLINQWANVMRWEMRPRLFLRTAEFLWQEGHTAHETAEEAMEETRQMHEVYERFLTDHLAVPVIAGEKTEAERFPGALNTFTVEAMVQDRKAIQAGTSHFLGQNFSKAAGIEFEGREGKREFAWTTSWGVSTRLIGTLLMAHSDDDGFILPPRVAPTQIVILPVMPKPEHEGPILEACQNSRRNLKGQSFHGRPVTVESTNVISVAGSRTGSGSRKVCPSVSRSDREILRTDPSPSPAAIRRRRTSSSSPVRSGLRYRGFCNRSRIRSSPAPSLSATRLHSRDHLDGRVPEILHSRECRSAGNARRFRPRSLGGHPRTRKP